MTTRTIRLGVNIDHVATLRQQRGTSYPDVLLAAQLAVEHGADLITVHLREDRRHIQDADVEAIRAHVAAPLNLEMALTDEMLTLAEVVRPDWVCLVPERRQELTTEGGLDVLAGQDRIRAAAARLRAAGIRLSLFVDADPEQVQAAAECGADAVELHTGEYADASDPQQRQTVLQRLAHAASQSQALGLGVHAGHGLTLDNVGPIAALAEVTELNIGHAIVAEAIMRGLPRAVADMRAAIDRGLGNF